jgi:hypothetical protein
MTKRYAPLIKGMIAGNIPGYNGGLSGTDQEFITRASTGLNQRSLTPVTIELEKRLAFFNSVIDAATEDLRPRIQEQKDAYMESVRSLRELGAFTKTQLTEHTLQTAKVDRFPGLGKTHSAHMSTGTNITGRELGELKESLLSNLQQRRPVQYETDLDRITKLSENLPDRIFSLKDALLIDISDDINQALAKNKEKFNPKTAVTTSSFMQDYDARGVEKLRTLVTSGEGNFDSLLALPKEELGVTKKNLRELDDLIGNQIRESGAEFVVDTEKQINSYAAEAERNGEEFRREQFISLERVGNTVLANIDQFDDGIQQVIRLATKKLTEIRIDSPYITESEARAMGITGSVGEFKSGRALSGESGKYRPEPGGVGPMMSRQQIDTALGLGRTAANSIDTGAGTESPSKFTIETGEDLGRGLEIGMQSRMDDVARIARQLGDTAVTESGLIVPKSAIPTATPVINSDLTRRMQLAAGGGSLSIGRGAPFDPNYKVVQISPQEITQAVAAGVGRGSNGGTPPPPTTFNSGPAEEFNDKLNKNTSSLVSANDKLKKLNSNLMKGSFAITSIAASGSMIPGPFQKISQQVMKYSGLMFGLMSATQALTNTTLAEAAAKRLSIAREASRNAALGTGLASKSR